MKNYYPVFVILIVLLMLACSAGCSSKETPYQRESVGRPSVTVTPPTPNADQVVSQNTRSIPSPSITRPQLSPRSTIPAPTGTIGSMVYENVSEIMVTAQEISAAWDPNGLACNSKSCTAGFVNINGDTVHVKTTLYDSVDSAKSGYNTEKQNNAAYRIIPLEIPDESYGWMQKSQSSVVFRKNNAVVIVDYTTNSGPASITTVKEFAGMYSQNL
ncbi:MAG: hypothetical protein WCJ93_06240 [Methanomicrobiales archaeon]